MIEIITPTDENNIFTNPRLIKAKNPNSIMLFLAGPSERVEFDKDWRVEAIDTIKEFWDKENTSSLDLIIFSPLNPKFKVGDPEYHFTQTFWETEALEICNRIIFWIPRRKDLPGMTTNIEIGQWMNHCKTFIGLPPEGIKNEYIKDRLKIYNKEYYEDLYSLVSDTINDAIIEKIS